MMNTKKSLKRAGHNAFTLIELLLVMVILVILAGVAINKFVGIREKAFDTRAKSDITNIKNALEQFNIVNGRYPTQEEGLQALVTRPGGELPDWKPCLDKLPIDPWTHPYIYRVPGSNDHEFDIVCCGPDGHEGGADDIQ